MIQIPVPASFVEWLWFGIGINFARAFGKQMDQTIQASDWFKARSPPLRWFIERLLDALHHWYIGGLLIAYGGQAEAVWFGWGVLVDDLPDIPRRAKKLFQKIGQVT